MHRFRVYGETSLSVLHEKSKLRSLGRSLGNSVGDVGRTLDPDELIEDAVFELNADDGDGDLEVQDRTRFARPITAVPGGAAYAPIGNLDVPTQKAVWNFFKTKFGGSQAAKTVEQRYRKLLDQAKKNGRWERSKDWYRDAHNLAKDIVRSTPEDSSLDLERIAGVLAAISPQMNWDAEEAWVRGLVRLHLEDKINLSQESLAAAAEIKQIQELIDDPINNVSEIKNGMRYSDLPPQIAARIMRLQMIDEGMQGNRLPVPAGYNPLGKAVEILRNDDVDKNLAGLKVRSFYNNIANPEDLNNVTIDVHMINAALDGATPPSGLKNLSRSIKGRTTELNDLPALAEIVARLAKEYGISPSEAQAIIWVEWRERSPE